MMGMNTGGGGMKGGSMGARGRPRSGVKTSSVPKRVGIRSPKGMGMLGGVGRGMGMTGAGVGMGGPRMGPLGM